MIVVGVLKNRRDTVSHADSEIQRFIMTNLHDVVCQLSLSLSLSLMTYPGYDFDFDVDFDFAFAFFSFFLGCAAGVNGTVSSSRRPNISTRSDNA